MKFSISALVVAALAVGQATAATIGHGRPIKHNHAARHAEMMENLNEKRGLLSELASSKLVGLGVKAVGLNSATKGAKPWIGTDGDYTNEFINQSAEDIILVIWGVAGSWVNAVQADITVTIPKNGSQTISFPRGTGGWAPIYSDTKMVNGQISETWGEFTFGDWSTVDVSREVNMAGKNMKIVTPKCVSDMNTCVFVCGNGETTCMYGYKLQNCEPGSQEGANKGTHFGADSGGCSGMGAKAALKTYLGY